MVNDSRQANLKDVRWIMIDIGEPDDYQVENGRQVDLTDIR